MAAIDYAIQETNEGEFDLILTLEKVTSESDLLFQQVDLLLNTYTGEFLYDTTDGMPYDDILGQNFDLTSLENLYYDKISVLTYFQDLRDFQVNIDSDRKLNISFDVFATNGQSQNFNFSQGL